MAKFKVLEARGWDLIPSSHNFINLDRKASRSERRIKWMR